MQKVAKQQGFTLIELIAVIVILGILAATAVPKFIDMSDAAKDAGAKGLAGSLNSSSAVNYAAYSACSADLAGADSSAIVDTSTGVSTCLAAAEKFVTIDSNTYTIAGTYSSTVGTANTCTVGVTVESVAKTFQFTMYAVSAPSAGTGCVPAAP